MPPLASAPTLRTGGALGGDIINGDQRDLVESCRQAGAPWLDLPEWYGWEICPGPRQGGDNPFLPPALDCLGPGLCKGPGPQAQDPVPADRSYACDSTRAALPRHRHAPRSVRQPQWPTAEVRQGRHKEPNF